MTTNHHRGAEPPPKKKHTSKIKTAVALLLALACLSQPTHAPATGLIPSTNSSPPALDFWQFSDTNWLSHFGNAPISYTNLVNVPYLGDGNCLLLDSTNAAWLQYSTTQNGTNRLSVPTGSSPVRGRVQMPVALVQAIGADYSKSARTRPMPAMVG